MSKIILPVTPTEGYFGQSTYEPNGTYGPRKQRGIQIFHMISGKVIININNEKKILKAGESTLLLPGQSEFFQFGSSCRNIHGWCQLDFEIIPDDFNRNFIKLSSYLNTDNRLAYLMSIGLNMQTAMFNCHQTLIKLAEATLNYYIELAKSDETQESLNERLISAKKFIESNFHKSITLRDIGESIHYSIPHLIHLFKTNFSTTPANYLRSIRIKHAKELLIKTNKSIALIAEQCGFISQFHFSRLFKEEIGISPKYFRNQNR